MKKVILSLLILFVLGVSGLWAQDADVVVLMDTSGTLLPWFDQINSRVLPDITEKFIRKGDTFHLISFNSRVNLELVQPIENEADISRIVSRFMLLYPLGKNSDFLSGLKYTWQYISGLNQQRQKIIIVISDGIFNPPESSPYASYTLQQVQEEVAQSAGRIRGAGWNVYYIKLPYPEDVAVLSLDGNFVTEKRDQTGGGATAGTGPSGETSSSVASAAGRTPAAEQDSATDSGGYTSGAGTGGQSPAGDGSHEAGAPSYSPISPDAPISNPPENSYYDISREFTDELDIPQTILSEDGDTPLEFTDSVFHLPKITFPENLGKQARHFTLPLDVENTADYEVNMQLTEVLLDSTNILEKTVFLKLPAGKKGTLKAPLVLPENIEGVSLEIPVELKFSDNLRVDPQTGTIRMDLVDVTAESFFRTRGFVISTVLLILIALVALIALILFISNRTTKPVAEINKAARGTPRRYENENRQEDKNAAVSSLSSAPVYKQGAVAESAYSKPYTTEPDSKADVLAAFGGTAVAAKRSASPAGTGFAAASFEHQSKANAEDARAKYNVLGNKSDGFSTRRESYFKNLPPKSSGIMADSDGKIMLNLFVENQNTNIGKRNVHQMKTGSSLTIGGGASPFLIFLVKFPPNLAEVRYTGRNCSLAILKPEYFPYEKSTVINDCIDRPITVVSSKGYSVTFMIRQFEDPVVTLNRLLNSINDTE